jgi:outer membrane cobalamin receptor
MGMNPVVMSEVVVNKDKITWIKDVSLSANVELNVLIIEELRYKDSERLIKVEDPTAMTMTSKEIEKSPLLREPVDLIATMPGVTKKGGQLYFRGARSDAILYFIDGVKNRGSGLGIPSSAIGEITVYTGGIPAKYGDVTGGIVVVETKSYFDLYNANK